MAGTPSPANPPNDPGTEAELWGFAVSFYDKDGIAAACLVLQDHAGVDVTLLIFAVFAATRLGVVLKADELAAADRAVRAWRAEIVEPLRRLRRRLKAGPRPAPCSRTERLRDGLKALELQAEQIEFAILSGWLGSASRRGSEAAEAAAIPELVMQHFARDQAIDAKVAEALSVLANATRQITGRTTFPPR
jgi:uncharacterized protein (TIGR02444 family)